MDINLAIISLSILLQLMSALLARRLILLTDSRIVGVIVIVTVSLMGFRCGISLNPVVGGKAIRGDLSKCICRERAHR